MQKHGYICEKLEINLHPSVATSITNLLDAELWPLLLHNLPNPVDLPHDTAQLQHLAMKNENKAGICIR